MKRLLLAAVLIAVSLSVAFPTSAVPDERWAGTWSGPHGTTAPNDRQYYVYEPPRLQPSWTKRSLVVYLHGTTQTAIAAARSTQWNDLADEKGFVVIYPEQATDSGMDGRNGARAWSWGRAAYEARDQAEMGAIAAITRDAIRRYRIAPDRVFIGGVSAGGIMSTVMAASYPELYSAAAIWAGCSYLCADASGQLGYERMGKDNARVVPAILFAGSTDYLVNPVMSATAVSGWVGMNDRADDGAANGSVAQQGDPVTYGADAESLEPSPNPGPSDGSRGDAGTCLFVTNPHGNNPCPGGTLGWESYPYTVTRFGTADAVVVESWFIHGVSHNYPGGSTDGTYADPIGPDTTRAAWNFFVSNRRRQP